MSQDFTDNCYVFTNLITSDLQYIENNFIVLKTSFSGSSAPTTGSGYSVVAGLTWYDYANTQLKYRNAANNGWMYFFPGDTTSKIWAYRNDAVEGMVVDSSVTDKVLALKGGSQSYNINGGNTGGAWGLPHTHGVGTYTANTYHRHDGDISSYPAGANTFSVSDIEASNPGALTDYQGSTTNSVTGTSAIGNTIAAWRPSAAVGVLVKPDL